MSDTCHLLVTGSAGPASRNLGRLDLQVQPRAIWAGCLVSTLNPIARLNLSRLLNRRGFVVIDNQLERLRLGGDVGSSGLQASCRCCHHCDSLGCLASSA